MEGRRGAKGVARANERKTKKREKDGDGEDESRLEKGWRMKVERERAINETDERRLTRKES